MSCASSFLTFVSGCFNMKHAIIWKKKILHIHFFSPKELVAHAKKPFNLPFIGGPKGFAPDPDNEDEKTALECLLQEQRDVLKEERIHKK